MQRIKQTIAINAPVARVFEQINDPVKLHAVWPSLVDVKNVQATPDGSYTFDWEYKMVGIKLHGRSETIECLPNKRLVKRTTGIDSTFRWTFTGTNGTGTKLDLEVDYEIPVPVLGRFAEMVVAKMNQREAEALLQNMKIALEGSAKAELQAAPQQRP